MNGLCTRTSAKASACASFELTLEQVEENVEHRGLHEIIFVVVELGDLLDEGEVGVLFIVEERERIAFGLLHQALDEVHVVENDFVGFEVPVEIQILVEGRVVENLVAEFLGLHVAVQKRVLLHQLDLQRNLVWGVSRAKKGLHEALQRPSVDELLPKIQFVFFAPNHNGKQLLEQIDLFLQRALFLVIQCPESEFHFLLKPRNGEVFLLFH